MVEPNQVVSDQASLESPYKDKVISNVPLFESSQDVENVLERAT